MASAHLLRRDKSESHDTGPPPLSAPLCSAARALSPRPPFCTRHVPPTVMLQGQPERVALRSCTAHLPLERAVASPDPPHTHVSAHTPRHQRANVFTPKLLLTRRFHKRDRKHGSRVRARSVLTNLEALAPLGPARAAGATYLIPSVDWWR